jgi:hypothetical protein
VYENGKMINGRGTARIVDVAPISQ